MKSRIACGSCRGAGGTWMAEGSRGAGRGVPGLVPSRRGRGGRLGWEWPARICSCRRCRPAPGPTPSSWTRDVLSRWKACSASARRPHRASAVISCACRPSHRGYEDTRSPSSSTTSWCCPTSRRHLADSSSAPSRCSSSRAAGPLSASLTSPSRAGPRHRLRADPIMLMAWSKSSSAAWRRLSASLLVNWSESSAFSRTQIR